MTGRDDQPPVLERGESGAAGWLAQATRLVLGIRSLVLLLTLAYASSLDRPVVLALAVLIAAVSSLVPLRMWDRVGPKLVRHPLWLAGEVVLATLILVITGVESPFYSYTLGTAVLAGLLYGFPGAAVFGPLLAGVYLWVADIRSDVSPLPDSFQLEVGLPALYVITALAGAAARQLLDRVATAERELAEQESTAAAERERGRLARDMHDSLAKTVHGIGFSALALSRRIEKDPAAAAADARQLAQDAKVAAQEARDLIAGLRERQEESTLAPGPALRAEAAEWSATTQIPMKLRIEDVSDLPPVAARELRWILKEALRNVSRHGKGTQRVSVSVRRLGGRVVLSVIDDGPGFEVPDDLATLSANRHYGVVGMRERAQVAGGDLDIESAPGEGCTISVWVPAAAPETPQRAEPVPVAEPPAPAPDPEPAAERRPRRARPEAEPEPEPSAAPARTVSGYQWQ